MSSTGEVEAPAVDAVRNDMVEVLTGALGDAVESSVVLPGKDLWVRVRTDAWLEAGRVARDTLGLTYFCFLSGLDWLPSPFGRGEDDPTEPAPERSSEIVQGVAGGSTRFQVFARLVSPVRHLGLTLKVDVPDDTLEVASWVPLFAGADWHERECWEMYGITFAGHPGLRHLYLPGAFEGHPLRKDFPLLARMVKPWPGIVDVEPMPAGQDEGNAEGADE